MGENGPNEVGQTNDVVVRKAERGWVVGEENVSDLTSAMVLADLFAADQAVTQDTGMLEAVDADGAPRRPPTFPPSVHRHALLTMNPATCDGSGGSTTPDVATTPEVR